ncbi:vitamin D-binding protein [Anolis carolinensis]|uniref:Vitamin D-binding protein n=1 Tax=Anolis carolinensis TaxID=28377 RepID=G1KNL0_ANOCA|nr:PREDICTED: vitamin D-binding protein [Anolis carolinensis]|eukprot:XP_008110383.1 PREDICTED: vitamin D-binding protein [Anolis carolinensis]
MKVVIISIFLLVLTCSHALERGRDYFKEKICQEFNSLGKDKFRSITIVLNSRKYCSATFEEISSIVNEIVALAEKCCVEGADPECYNTESTTLSAKSCDPNSPFPKHPGTAACCTEEGLARKLCLAALKHPPKEFFTYMEPSSDEICEAFKKDPQDIEDRFLYEYSSDNSHTPLPLLLASTTTYLSIVGKCCTDANPVACFLKERLERTSLRALTQLSNKACSRYAVFGKDKTKLSYFITFTQRSPTASFDDVLSLAEDSAEVLSKCCDSMEEHCIQKEVLAHTAKICEKLPDSDDRIKQCCTSATDLRKYLCIYSLPWAKPVDLPDFVQATEEVLCGEGQERAFYEYIHYTARKFPRAPEAIHTALYDAGQKFVNACCSDPDFNACFNQKRLESSEETLEILSKGNQLCDDYTDHIFLEFKKRLRDTYVKKFPNATEAVLSALVQQRGRFASTCCFLNAPPSYCGMKVKTAVVETCTPDICVKN